MCDRSGYRFGGTIEFDYQGHDVRIAPSNVVEDPPGRITFSVHLDYVNFRGVSPIRVLAKVGWQPLDAMVDEINKKNRENVAAFSEKTRQEYQKAFVDAARERIKLASRIEPRKFEELREEERIVVYRRLIQDMLTKDVPTPDDRTHHVVAELLNTIFDIDKMLYFVAPEWWRPRRHRSHQSLGGIRKDGVSGAGGASGAGGGGPSGAVRVRTTRGVSNTVYGHLTIADTKHLITTAPKAAAKFADDSQIAAIDTVTWGGAGEGRADNYYITDESTPARLGSSLGWLLQLDGDNLRNAFLNAPWVKAVIPIRPGKERAAINWLQRVHVEGTEGLDDQYVAPPEQLATIPHAGPVVTIRDAIHHLCDGVADKHARSLTVDRYPTDEIHDDNRVSATPVDKVYEHGFYPLQGGFRAMAGNEDFEVFDQWVEVLPTDQVVPVEVTYDPKTGRQL
jgi:hypothetical protein